MLARFVALLGAFFVIAACDQDAAGGKSPATEPAARIFDPATETTAAALRDAAMAGSGAWDILESLTTEIGPRLAGSENDARAVVWAVNRFKALGYDRVWTEPFTIEGWRRVAAAAEIVSPYPHHMAITSLGRGASTPDGGIIAEIAHFETLDDLKAASREAVSGKIVFISYRMERHRDGAGYGKAVVARGAGASEAAKRGAVAIIIRSIGTDSHRLPHTGGVRYEEGVARIAAGAISNPDADILVRILQRGAPVRVHVRIINEDLGTVETANVIGEITGAGAAEEIVLIGGHLDSWDLGTGAIDDGAGVAITMAAGQLIGALATRPRRTVRVVAFGAEEIGLFGAKAYAEAHQDELGRHIIAAESDFGSGRIYQLAPGIGEQALPAAAAIARLLEPLGISLGDNDGGGGPDITFLRQAGVAVASLRQDGTVYFDLHHTADDTLDKVDAADLDQNVAAYAVFAYLAAQYDGRFEAGTVAGD